MANKRNMIRAVSFLTVSVIMLAFFMFFYYRTAAEKREAEEIRLRNSYYGLCDGMAGVNSALDELCSLPDELRFAEYAAKLKSASELALNALSAIPSGEGGCDSFRLCLAQSGGYAVYAAQRRVSGDFGGEEENNLLMLRRYLREALSGIYAAGEKLSDPGKLTCGDISRAAGLELLFSDYSPLYYDGEHSARIEYASYAYERENVPVDRKQAAKLAADILGRNLTLTGADNTLSELPVYSFYCNNAFVEISKNGGYPVRLYIEAAPGETSLSESVLLDRAAAFAAQYGYEGLEPVERRAEEGFFYVTFCYTFGEGGVRVTDLTASVTVGCTSGKGRICYLDGSRYLKSADSAVGLPEEPGEYYIIYDGSGSRRLCRREGEYYVDYSGGGRIMLPLF